MLRLHTTVFRIVMTIFGWNRGGFLTNQGQGNQGGHYQPPSQPPGSNTGSGSNMSTLAMITLGLGIAAWTILPGVAAWAGIITGWIELKNIENGESDPSNKTITQVGFWACAINLILQFLSGCLAVAIFVFGWAAFAGILGLSAAEGG